MESREELIAMGMTDAEIEGLLTEDDPDSKRTIGELMDEAGEGDEGDEAEADAVEEDHETSSESEASDGEEEGDRQEEVLIADSGEQGEPKQQATPVPEAVATQAPPFATPPTVAPVEGYDDAVADLYASKRKIDQEWNDGDLYDSEREEKQRELDKQIAGLIKQQAIYEQQQTAHAAYINHQQSLAISAFKAEHPEYDTSRGRMILLQEAIREVEAKGVSDPITILTQAHAVVCADLGVHAPVLKGKGKPDAARVEIPPTLGGIPTASVSTVDESWISHGMRLRGDAFESWFGGLSASQQDAFMRH